jgi:uncharacterized lipoprotein YddW (UPF0748 family)
MRRILAGLAAVLALAAAAGADEVRGVWLSPSQFGPDRETAVERLGEALASYRRSGINTLLVMVKSTSGFVYYPSRLAARDPRWDWDFAGEFIRQADRLGFEVQAWFCVFPEAALPGRVRENPEWLVRNKTGEYQAALNPANPEARRYEQSLMEEFLDLYPSVGWIHLDYIRFPCEPAEPSFSYDPGTRRLFEDLTGQDPLTARSQDSGNPLWNRWIEWNGLQVTTFVRELRARLAGRSRPVRISAAVFPDAANAKVLIGQDWASWAEGGLVDMLCPMLYTNDLEYFDELVRRAVTAGRNRCLVCPGIGVRTSHNQNTPEGLAAEVESSRRLGADGVVFFSGSSLAPEFLDRLRSLF